MTDLRAPLRALFGFDAFRPGQEEVVRAAVEGRDTLAVMPTGSGKSLTYQLAAMLRPAPTLVLSPLIALMKDQVDGLPAGIASTATFVNSSLDADETTARLAGVLEGRTRLLYAAPERLRQRSFADLLRRAGVGLVVIDEAHCVSMWGHDFRPDYLFIRRALEALGDPPVLGMTATATPTTAEEIGQALGRPLDVVRTTVVRENLRYEVVEAANEHERLTILVERLTALEAGSAIVYARSRRSCEEISRTLRGHGLAFEHYHAGLDAAERTRVQDAFLAGRIRGVVATTAFGMGIDKPDVRLVCLVNLPDSLESYVQMVGRAGRDGAPSETLLLAGEADGRALRRFATEGIPTAHDLRAVYRVLRDADGPVTPEALDAAVREGHDARVIVGMLEQAGLARRGFDRGRLLDVALLPAPDGSAGRVEALLERYGEEARARCERMIGFTTSSRCRHAQVAEHFGEALEPPCGACDVCAPRPRTAARPAAPPLPDDLGEAIHGAVAGLTWPLGRKSLVLTLRGSVKAPPSGRRSPAYGALAAATDAEVRRWIRALETAGALVEQTTEDGYTVLVARPGADVPALRVSGRRRAAGHGRPARGSSTSAEDGPAFDALRAWRSERSRGDGVPPYVVFSDATLRELAELRPGTLAELAAVRGVGPAKLDRYGDDVLTVLAGA